MGRPRALALAAASSFATADTVPLSTPPGSQSGPSIPIANGPKGTAYVQPAFGSTGTQPTMYGGGVGVARNLSPSLSVGGNVGVTGTTPTGQPAVSAGAGFTKRF